MNNHLHHLSTRLTDLARKPQIRAKLIEPELTDVDLLTACFGRRSGAGLVIDELSDVQVDGAANLCRSFLATCDELGEHVHLDWLESLARTTAERTFVLYIGGPQIFVPWHHGLFSTGQECLEARAAVLAAIEEMRRVAGDPSRFLGAVKRFHAANERLFEACGYYYDGTWTA